MRGMCKTCSFYLTHDFKRTAKFGGDCLRYPAMVRKTDDDWCGEHVKKRKLKEDKS
jgi:hypothetical protein